MLGKRGFLISIAGGIRVGGLLLLSWGGLRWGTGGAGNTPPVLASPQALVPRAATPTTAAATATPRPPARAPQAPPTPIPTLPAVPTTTPTPQGVITTVRITEGNVRSSPAIGQNIIGEVRQGDEVILLGVFGDWYLVRLGAQQGWVARSVVTAPRQEPPLLTPTVEP